MKYFCLLLAASMVSLGVQAAVISSTATIEKDAAKPIVSLDQAAELAKSAQNRFWKLVPPMDDPLYIHSEGTVRAVDWKSGEWPEKFLKQMVAEMKSVNSSLYPVYRLTVVEARTGELLWYNALGRLVWKTPAPLDYNEYLFALQAWDVASAEELSAQQKLFGRSSNVGLELLLLPVAFIDSYEEDVAIESEAVAAAEPMAMAMSAPLAMGMGSSVELQMEIGRSNGTVEVFVEWLSSLDSDSLDLFLCSDLVAANWQLQTNFPTAGSTNFYWTDQDTNQIVRFYVTGTMYDGDFDGLASARERYLYKTREDLFDSDGDGLGDGWELGYGFDPLSILGTNGALGDADNDGLSNLEEQLNGTDPLVSNGTGTTGRLPPFATTTTRMTA